MAYLLDTDVFIQAKQRHYGMDFCPGFWDWLIEATERGQVFSIERVADELEVIEDQLAEWTAARSKSFFLPPDEQMLGSLAQVAEWVQGQEYRPAAVSTSSTRRRTRPPLREDRPRARPPDARGKC